MDVSHSFLKDSRSPQCRQLYHSMESDNEETGNNKPRQLTEQSVKDAQDAISRGRKRRFHRMSVASGDIQIGRTSSLSCTQLVNPGKRLPTALQRKRCRITLIPGTEEQADDDSNDEWEEHIEIDRNKALAAIEAAKSNNTTQIDPSITQSRENGNIACHSPTPEERSVGRESSRSPSKEISKDELKARERLISAGVRKKLHRRHSLHISLLTGYLMRLDAAAENETIRALALSVTPAELFVNAFTFNELLSRLALWVPATFRMTAMLQKSEDRNESSTIRRLCNVEERILHTISTGKGDVFDILTLVAATLRQQKVRCRVVSALQPVSHQVTKEAKPQKSTGRHNQVIQMGPSVNYESIMYGWLEVWTPVKQKWLPIDLLEGVVCSSSPSTVLRKSAEQIPTTSISQAHVQEVAEMKHTQSAPTTRRGKRERAKRSSKTPATVEAVKKRVIPKCFFSHVVAIECEMVTDVSRRYANTWADIESSRASGKLFLKCVEMFGRTPRTKAELEAQRLEKAEFDEIAAGDVIPTTISGVQKHPRYVLDRHVKKYEVIYPKKPVIGYVNDEPIYLRANICLLHTKDRWIRKMRKVLDDVAPVNAVRSKNGTDATVDLFGEWQTKDLVIRPVVDGEVPRGEHGNVDLWTADHLPPGGVHINHAFARRAASRLGINYAPAMTGFELRRMRSVPKIEGVVVAIEHEVTVREVATKLKGLAEEREKEKEQLDALERWGKLLRSMNARDTVRRKYGGLYDDQSNGAKVAGGLEEQEGEDVASRAKNNTENDDGRDDSIVHVHMFDVGIRVTEDVWLKICKECGLEVKYEEL